MNEFVSRASLPLILLLAAGACSGDNAVCGDSGTFTVELAEGGCTCEPGYVWDDPESDALLCVPDTCSNCIWGCRDGACEPSPIGGPCRDDTDCAPGGTCLTDPVRLPGGYCTVRDCAANGCPEGSECLSVDGDALCLADCDGTTCRAGYSCLAPGACWAHTAQACPALCQPETTCAHTGDCVPQPPAEAPPGPIPACDALPSWECDGDEAYCGELVPFEPVLGPGYWNYPLNGETTNNQYRSFARRDLVLLVKHAAAATHCLTAAWQYGSHEPLGLGDMSEADGSIPGTSDGDPGHPVGSHTDGHDADIAYFQLGMPDNKLRPVCPYVQGGGDAYHCLGAPDLLDTWRTALFIGELHDSPQTLWVGVDGQIGPIIEQTIDELCDAGWLDNGACTRTRVEYEVQNYDWGWYYFHHHHLHLSLKDQYGNHPEL